MRSKLLILISSLLFCSSGYCQNKNDTTKRSFYLGIGDGYNWGIYSKDFGNNYYIYNSYYNVSNLNYGSGARFNYFLGYHITKNISFELDFSVLNKSISWDSTFVSQIYGDSTHTDVISNKDTVIYSTIMARMIPIIYRTPCLNVKCISIFNKTSSFVCMIIC